MTEARKEIIELISPFMDKTLSEGCYWTIIWSYYIYLWEYWGGTMVLRVSDNTIIHTDYWKIFKIIGSYDITAVCVVENNFKNCNFHYLIYLCSNWEISWTSKNWEFPIGEIPLKPLHLYTEVEEKSLLELLKQIA